MAVENNYGARMLAGNFLCSQCVPMHIDKVGYKVGLCSEAVEFGGTRFDQSECAICGVILALEKMGF